MCQLIKMFTHDPKTVASNANTVSRYHPKSPLRVCLVQFQNIRE